MCVPSAISAACRNEHISKLKTSVLRHKKCGEWPGWTVQCGTLWVGAQPCLPTTVARQIVGWRVHPQSRSLFPFARQLLRGLSIRQPATFDHLLCHHEQHTLMRPKSLKVHSCEKSEAEVEWYKRTKSKTKGQHYQNCWKNGWENG